MTSPDELDIDAERVEEIADETTFEGPQGEKTLREAIADIVGAHQDLTRYRQGGLALHQRLKERERDARAAGNDDVADVISDIKESAFALYERIYEGDSNLDFDSDEGCEIVNEGDATTATDSAGEEWRFEQEQD